MNGIMTTSSHSNFYNQDLVGAPSSSDHIPGPSSQDQPTNNNSPQHHHQHDQSQTTHQNHPLNQPIHHHPTQQNQLESQQSRQSHHLQQQQEQQQQQQQNQHNQQNLASSSTSYEMPSIYQQFTGSYQQTRVPKNFLLENANYYTLQPGFPLVQAADYYSTPTTTSANDYQNSTINLIISPSFQMGSVSTPDTQNSSIRSKQQQQHSYQQQQPQQLLQSQHQLQVPDIFYTQGGTIGGYVTTKQQQKEFSRKTSGDQTLVPQTNSKLQQQISETSYLQPQQQQQSPPTPQKQQQQQHYQHQTTQPYGGTGFMLYSQTGGPSSSPVAGNISIPTTIATTGQPNSQFQFTYGSPQQGSSSKTNQMYLYQRQQQQQQQHQQPQSQQMSQISQLSQQIPPQGSSKNILINSTPTKSRASSITTRSGRQSRSTSISSFIPQPDYPERVIRPKVATTRWDDENTNCYQVRARNILVSRREDTNYINGTKLLNVIGMTRGKRDGILKTEKIKNVVKVGSMNLKGVWIPFDRAYEIARNEGVDSLLYPLFVKDIKQYFLTKGHKLKSEDDEQEILEEGMTRQREEVRREGRSNGVGDFHNEEEEEIVGIQEDAGPNTAENDVPGDDEEEEDDDDDDDDDEEEGEQDDEEEEDGSSTSMSSSKNSESKLLETRDVIKSIVEEGDSTTGNVSEVKYVHEYLERSPQSTAIKEEDLYYGSSHNTPLTVHKTL